MKPSVSTSIPLVRIAALTLAAVAIHGYHLGVEDGEIYVPAARKLLDPSLYPFGAEFFFSHARLSMFSHIVAWTAAVAHISADWAIFAWFLVSLFAMLASCWILVRVCFESGRARWSAMLVMTAVLAMPATNTGLLLMDPYLTARSLSTPLTVFSLAVFLERRYVLASLGVLATALIHPQMVVYLLLLIAIIRVSSRVKVIVREPVPVLASAFAILPVGLRLTPASGPYREALYSRDYFFLYNWSWYHWIGMLAPLAILVFFWKADLRGTFHAFRRISFALVPFGLLAIAVAAVFSSSDRFEMLARFQPLRVFHLVTLVFVLLFAGVLGEFLGKTRPWIMPVVSVLLAAGMFEVSRQTYPHSPHVEFPSDTSSNPWVNTLLWVRNHTPKDAVFAVDSRYFKEDMSDVHGFRAISARSALADYYKDSGVVSLFPDLAEEWKQMSDATYGLNHFDRDRFLSLRQAYPQVSWTVIHGPAPAGFDCPYQRQGYSVCRLPAI